MKRRDLVKGSTAFGLLAAFPFSDAPRSQATPAPLKALSAPLKPPERGGIPVAFLVSDGAVIIDFCGPWEVFQDTSVPGRDGAAFHLYTVAETRRPIRASGGMTIVPSYTFETAPAPRVIVIPAQGGRSEATLAWIRRSAQGADLTMSVCTGAFLLASTGLLSGKAATTHHNSYRSLAVAFPDVKVKRGARFVEDGRLATAGGLSSGIDLALRVVERYYGREVAKTTAYQMEYQGQGWLDADSNAVYAPVPVSSESHPLCPVCEMEADPQHSPTSVYKGKAYFFCTAAHKQQFDAAPDTFATAR